MIIINNLNYFKNICSWNKIKLTYIPHIIHTYFTIFLIKKYCVSQTLLVSINNLEYGYVNLVNRSFCACTKVEIQISNVGPGLFQLIFNKLSIFFSVTFNIFNYCVLIRTKLKIYDRGAKLTMH